MLSSTLLGLVPATYASDATAWLSMTGDRGRCGAAYGTATAQAVWARSIVGTVSTPGSRSSNREGLNGAKAVSATRRVLVHLRRYTDSPLQHLELCTGELPSCHPTFRPSFAVPPVCLLTSNSGWCMCIRGAKMLHPHARALIRLRTEATEAAQTTDVHHQLESRPRLTKARGWHSPQSLPPSTVSLSSPRASQLTSQLTSHRPAATQALCALAATFATSSGSSSQTAHCMHAWRAKYSGVRPS